MSARRATAGCTTTGGGVLIAGRGESQVGVVPDRTAIELYVDCILAAVDDAGVGVEQVDGLITMNCRTDPRPYHAEAVAEYLGIQPRIAYTLQTGGATALGAITQAASLIACGYVRTVVLAAADNLRSGLRSSGAVKTMASDGAHPDYEAPYGASVPGFYALLAQRHMYDYGTTRAQLASVAVAMRQHAERNQRAQSRAPISVDDVVNSRVIAEPFGKLDCSLISDGGGAIVLTAAAERRGDRHAVRLLGAGEAHRYEYISQAENLSETAAVESGARAFGQAGIRPDDVDVVFLYDAFTILPILFLEDLGFCAKGDGGPFVADGNVGPSGRLPVNPHGGLLSYCHPGRSGAMFMLTEMVTQLRGQAQQRQVADAEVALVHAEGGISSSHATLLFGRER